MIETLQPTASLPYSEESERAVLACILLDTSVLPLVSGRVTDEDFYLGKHQILYRAMVSLQDESTPIDLRTLQARLEQQDQFAEVGGVAYIATLDLDLPDLGRVEDYVEIIKERSIRRRLIQSSQETIRNSLDGGLSAQEALGMAEASVLSLGEEAIQRGFQQLGHVVEATLDELEDHPGTGLVGLDTGYPDLNAMTQGLHKGNLIILAGRPGMGKTSLALNLCQHIAIETNEPVGFFSLEMGASELAMRIICSEAAVSFRNLRSGHASREQWERINKARKKLRDSPLFIDDSANPSLLEVASKARRLRAERGLSMLVIDYLQLMQAGGRFENRNLEIGAMSRGLKQLAKELEIPVMALSQLSRNPERRGSDHRPQLSDLRESGNIEQDADIVAFVYRDEIYHPDDPELQGKAELILAKHRNGETGHIDLVFLGDITSFKSADRMHGMEPPPF